MSLSRLGNRLGYSVLRFSSLGVSLGVVLLSGGGHAIAAQPFVPTASPLQVAQSSTTNTGDVIVNPEPQRPGSTTTPSTTNPSSTTTAAGTRFSCEMVNGQYTVMYRPESQPTQSYPWAIPSNMGGGWDANRRCAEISRRLETYRPDGLLEMKTGMENGYNTVCVTTEKVSSCRIVLTVPNGQDPTSTRDRVFQNLTVADSGQQTQGVNTYVGGGGSDIVDQIGQAIGGLSNIGKSASGAEGINLRPFLDRRDGGTGEQLGGAATIRSTPRRLNPGNFR
ncbi:MAG: COP23 domain-containing protein [Lyngbya sp. HA4199-MV5]|nr:COP23 domain-containing protein [Lyngbya sp. HA4199-MV5]